MRKLMTRHECRTAALPNHRRLDWEYIVMLIAEAANDGLYFIQLPGDVLLTDTQERALVAAGFSVSDISAPSADPCTGDALICIRISWIA
jgi:hypothetical protein